MASEPGHRRRQRCIMTTDSEWLRIREQASAAGMSTSRYIVHRLTGPAARSASTVAGPLATLPMEVQLRLARDLLVIAKIEELRTSGEEGGVGFWRDAVAEAEAWLNSEIALG